VPSAEARRRTRRPLCDRRNRRASALEFGMGLAQRAQVLVAEGSAEVAQESEDERPLAPQLG